MKRQGKVSSRRDGGEERRGGGKEKGRWGALWFRAAHELGRE